jgi:hypothetical protein
MGLKEFCTLLLAGGMGAGSVVAVQQVQPPRTQQARPAPKAKPASVAARQAAARIDDCPIYAPLPGSVLANLGMPENPQIAFGGTTLPRPGGGGGGGFEFPGLGGVDPFPPGGGGTAPIPEPAAWAMMVSGFGLIGLALRSGRSDQAESQPPA